MKKIAEFFEFEQIPTTREWVEGLLLASSPIVIYFLFRLIIIMLVT